MGRKTWESLPVKFRPLPDRENRVVTHSLDYGALGARTCTSLEKSLSEIGENIEKIFIIGGAEIFKQALGMKIISGIYITKIYKNYLCDTFFPEVGRYAQMAEKIKTANDHGTKIDFLFTKT